MLRGQNPNVIVLNGGSSSGKSSIARALQETLPGIWLTFGVDTFIDALPGKGDSARAGITFGPGGTIAFSSEYRTIENSWYSGLNAMSRSGARLILDEVFLSGSIGQTHLQSMFDEATLFWAGVHCKTDVAEARETQRPDRTAGMARQQASSVHDGVVSDIEVDTTFCSADECARDIAHQLGA